MVSFQIFLNGSDILFKRTGYNAKWPISTVQWRLVACFQWMRVVLTNRDTSRNPQSIELTDGAQVFLRQCFSYVEKAAQWQRTCHFALRVYLLRDNTKTKTCTTTIWSSKVENRILKLMIMMLYRIYKRLRPRQCRQFSNVHGYHSKSTFRVLIKQK